MSKGKTERKKDRAGRGTSGALKKVALGVGVLAAIQVFLWLVDGREYLDERVQRDLVGDFVEGLAQRSSPVKAYYLCDQSGLQPSTIEDLDSLLWEAGVKLIEGYADLAPFSDLTVDDCDCPTACHSVSMNTPLIALVETVWRPDITYSPSGATGVYLYVLGRWVRLGFVKAWST